MWKKETNKFTVQQRGGKDPDIVITTRRYMPVVDKTTKKRGKSKPVNHGITREQFHSILDKAAQPIEKPKED